MTTRSPRRREPRFRSAASAIRRAGCRPPEPRWSSSPAQRGPASASWWRSWPRSKPRSGRRATAAGAGSVCGARVRAGGAFVVTGASVAVSGSATRVCVGDSTTGGAAVSTGVVSTGVVSGVGTSGASVSSGATVSSGTSVTLGACVSSRASVSSGACAPSSAGASTDVVVGVTGSVCGAARAGAIPPVSAVREITTPDPSTATAVRVRQICSSALTVRLLCHPQPSPPTPVQDQQLPRHPQYGYRSPIRFVTPDVSCPDHGEDGGGHRRVDAIPGARSGTALTSTRCSHQ